MLTICNNCLKLNRVEAGKAGPICGHCKAELPVHGSVSELTGSTLQKLVEKSPLPILADFWAPWCGPCKAFAPAFEQVAEKLGEKAVFVKVNTEANPLAAQAFQIRGIPTLILFRGGMELTRESGAMPQPVFHRWLQQHLGL